ncbi:SEC10/PgrA surface exclusion domain-containing protein [Ligilactobacillus saerimneri]|uniref:SEC10/PgrA surface exclusion domain-containing protein n=1 Tax=Ligilactobacillus saerimneri TaxID=228229 RepID=UPI002941D962|nr:SEC10/PgrA surface exclusion domain-containing protein [Ligilactobacillus saerimneri]
MVSHNTKKALTIAGAGLATLAGSSVLSSNVSADAVAPDTTDVTNTTTDTPQAQHEAALKALDEAKAKDEQATQALNDAKKEADQAQANKDQTQDAVNQQQGQVDQAQKDTNQAQETVNKAQDDVAKAQENAKDATPENIANTEKAIKDQQDKIQQDATAVDQATQAVRDANQNVDQAQQTADQAQTNVNDKQSATNKAQQDLDNANEALADNDVEKAQNDYNQAQANTKQAQQDDANAKQAVTDTQNALEQANQKVSDALNTATEAQKTADNAQADYDAKNQAVNQSQQKVNKDLADIKAVEEAMANQNVINLPDGYVDALKEFAYGPYNPDDSKLIAIAKKGMELNQYHASKADKNRKVVFSPGQPLSDDIELELTQFAAQLLNPLASQFGKKGYVINGGSLAFAKEIAKKYDADKWNIYDQRWHDTKAINEVARDMGLSYDTNMKANGYEDMEGGDFVSDPKEITTSVAELKGWVYEAITRMLFLDGKDHNNFWGHATSLMMLNSTYDGTETFSLGVTVDSMGQKHILQIADFDAKPEGRYAQLAQTTYAVPDSNKLAEQKAQLQTQLKADQTDLGSKQQVASEALTVKQQADKDLATANQNLATARTSQQQAQQAASAAKTTADQAAQALITATNNEQAAKEKLAAVSADEATKQEAVNQAQAALKAAQDELAQAQQDLATKQAALKDAQNDLATKQTAVKTAQDQEQADRDQLAKLQQQLADYQNAPVLVQAAQDKLAQAQQDLAAKQTALKDAQNDLATKQTALKAAQDNFDQAQAKLDTAQANKDQADQELAAAIEAAKTNAEKYGDQVVVNPVGVTEGAKELPELTLANPQALPVARNTMALFARVAQSLMALPYGTTVAWNDATKALADMQKAGQYTEQALVTFPDGTTKVVDFKLTVTAVAKETTPNQPNTSHHQDNIEPLDGITDAQKASFAGYHVLDGRVVDANGKPVAGWTIRQGIIYNAEGVAVAKVGTSMATPTKAETTLKRTTTLPQTGEDESSWLSALGLTVLGTVSALGATLGLRKQN